MIAWNYGFQSTAVDHPGLPYYSMCKYFMYEILQQKKCGFIVDEKGLQCMLLRIHASVMNALKYTLHGIGSQRCTVADHAVA